VAENEKGTMNRIEKRIKSFISKTRMRIHGGVGCVFLALSVIAAVPGVAQTNRINSPSSTEQIRADCVNGRRYICGRVVQLVPEGLVVDSGYTSLLKPPFHNSWVVAGNVSASRDSSAVEGKALDSVCIGLVFLTDIRKRPAVKLYDYVVIHGYPAGQYSYVPVPKIQKTIRKFSGGLERAVKLNLEAGAK
jgi:hypothetical protein